MKVAVLGCGSIGHRHILNLKSLGVSDIMVHDPNPGMRDAAANEGNARACESAEDVFNAGPDAVLVTAPTRYHVPLASAAVRAGIPVFVEKPLSHSMDGVLELVDDARRRNVVTLVGCNMRFHPGPATVKQILENDVVGRVLSARIQSGSYLPDWRPHQDYRQSYSASMEQGGAILDQIHEIDLALWFFGRARVVAAAKRPASSIGLDTDGLAEILLNHEEGPLTSLHLNFVQRDYDRGFTIIGSEGTIRWDFRAREVTIHGPDGTMHDKIPQAADWTPNDMFVDELRHFLECVRSGRDTVNPVENGAEALHVALTARNWKPRGQVE